MSTGAAYCQLTDFLFRGKIPLRKVKWNSKSELDWISNWRLLQTSWKELGVEKAVPVERLIKGKFQDNFEFLQWFKKFFDANCTGNPYHPISARNGEPLPATVSTGPTRPVRMPVKKANPTNGVHTTGTRAPAATTSRAVNRATNGTSSSHAVTSDLSAALNALQIEREHGRELQTQLEEASTAIESIEKERNFYFLKLQKIETYCQNAGENAEVPTKPIFDVLYEVEEGFAAPEDIETNGVDEEAEENPNVTVTK
ncbi:unnamed protein product, partial [Anisakis simplex]|uniref:EB1 C-terminal domain-containing protein n=1 Tax=Anisakis simplex TaxID=6269 RepID=A0A0M3KGT8_ANISI